MTERKNPRRSAETLSQWDPEDPIEEDPDNELADLDRNESRVVDQDGDAVMLSSAVTFERIRSALKRGTRDVIGLGYEFDRAYEQVQDEAPGTWTERARFETGLSIRTITAYRTVPKLAGRSAIFAELAPSLLLQVAKPSTPEAVITGLIAGSIEPTEDAIDEALRRLRSEALQERLDVPPPVGTYRCIVMDPPWPMAKIIREERPNQEVVLDYPVMSLDEIAALPIQDLAHDEGCHLYLWTTHKFLPNALELLGVWGFSYECSLTWVKPGGMTPYSWMYNTEHCLFARRGNLPLIRQGLKLGFSAPVIRHSQKPDAFYERVVASSPEPRLEMFARSSRDEFTGWGNEVGNTDILDAG